MDEGKENFNGLGRRHGLEFDGVNKGREIFSGFGGRYGGEHDDGYVRPNDLNTEDTGGKSKVLSHCESNDGE